MDFKELNYIITTAECKSVTSAAKKLYISQPTLSYVINKTERELGVRLFDRSSNPIALTYAGEKYVEKAKVILREGENLRREMSDIAGGDSGRLNIGMPTERAGYMLPKVLGRFRESFPKADVHLVEARSSEIIRDLEEDKIELAVLPVCNKDLPGNMVTELICYEGLYLIAGDGMIKDGMLIKKGDATHLPLVDLSCVNDLPFIQTSSEQYIRKYIEQLKKTTALDPKEVIEVSSGFAAVQLAREGLGITIVSDRAIIPHGGLSEFNCYRFREPEDLWEVNVIYKKSTYLGRPASYFIGLLKEVFSSTSRNP
ncbi:MAG: LysR family transcriptional regulator [Solobacterium sp.]|nr:LysR family transcriptional regulator [Solobacterium sp.]